MRDRNPYDWVGRVGVLLAVIGAINWLLVGLFQWNLVSAIFTDSGSQTATVGERIIYVIVGVGGLVAIPMLVATLGRMRGARTDYGYMERRVGPSSQEEKDEEHRRAA